MHRALATKTPHSDLPATSRTKTTVPYHDENELGSAILINNWLCDKFNSTHITPIFLDFVQENEYGHRLVEKQILFHAEVTDGPLVDAPRTWRRTFLNLEPDKN
jgi:hypothetical protein